MTLPEALRSSEPAAVRLETTFSGEVTPFVVLHRRRSTAWRTSVLVVCIYAVVTVMLYWPVQPLSTTRIINCGCFDPALAAWFLAWTPNAIIHHLNPLFTTSIEYPYGMNLATNTFMPLLGIAAAPITLTLGPVAALNLLLRLAFVLSATSMYLVLQRFVISRRAAFVGGLFYGFSPYMIGQGSLHLNLVFVPVPPLILACLYELLVVRTRSPYRTGLLLGVLCIAQYLISVEILADAALLALFATMVMTLLHPRRALAAFGYVARGAVVAAGLIAVVIGYPVWFETFGPQHIPSTQGFGAMENINEDLLGVIVPTSHELLGGTRLIALGSSYVGDNLPEDGAYLGVTLLAVILVTLIVKWRNPLVRYCVLLALAADSLSLGRNLIVDNHSTSIAMPFEALWSLPLVSSELPARYSLFTDLFLAVVLAVGLDAVLVAAKRTSDGAKLPARARKWAAGFLDRTAGAPALADPDQPLAGYSSAYLGWVTGLSAIEVPQYPGPPPPPPPRRYPSISLGSVSLWRFAGSASLRFWLLAAFVLVPLVPRFGYPQPPTQVPSAFLASATAQSIPRGSVVLTYPYNAPPWNYAMLWQAAAGFPFKLIGGYGVAPNPGDVDYPATLQPATVSELFQDAWSDSKVPPFDDATFAQLRTFCIRWKVGTVLVVPLGGNSGLVGNYLTAALGAATLVDGVDVWLNADARASVLQAQQRS